MSDTPTTNRIDRLGVGTSDNGVDRLSRPSNPRGSVRETRLQIGGDGDASE